MEEDDLDSVISFKGCLHKKTNENIEKELQSLNTELQNVCRRRNTTVLLLNSRFKGERFKILNDTFKDIVHEYNDNVLKSLTQTHYFYLTDLISRCISYPEEFAEGVYSYFTPEKDNELFFFSQVTFPSLFMHFLFEEIHYLAYLFVRYLLVEKRDERIYSPFVKAFVFPESFFSCLHSSYINLVDHKNDSTGNIFNWFLNSLNISLGYLTKYQQNIIVSLINLNNSSILIVRFLLESFEKYSAHFESRTQSKIIIMLDYILKNQQSPHYKLFTKKFTEFLSHKCLYKQMGILSSTNRIILSEYDIKMVCSIIECSEKLDEERLALFKTMDMNSTSFIPISVSGIIQFNSFEGFSPYNNFFNISYGLIDPPKLVEEQEFDLRGYKHLTYNMNIKLFPLKKQLKIRRCCSSLNQEEFQNYLVMDRSNSAVKEVRSLEICIHMKSLKIESQNLISMANSLININISILSKLCVPNYDIKGSYLSHPAENGQNQICYAVLQYKYAEQFALSLSESRKQDISSYSHLYSLQREDIQFGLSSIDESIIQFWVLLRSIDTSSTDGVDIKAETTRYKGIITKIKFKSIESELLQNAGSVFAFFLVNYLEKISTFKPGHCVYYMFILGSLIYNVLETHKCSTPETKNTIFSLVCRDPSFFEAFMRTLIIIERKPRLRELMKSYADKFDFFVSEYWKFILQIDKSFVKQCKSKISTKI